MFFDNYGITYIQQLTSNKSNVSNSVADPGCFSRTGFSHPGSRRHRISHTGSGSWIQGVKKALDSGSQIRIRNTGFQGRSPRSYVGTVPVLLDNIFCCCIVCSTPYFFYSLRTVQTVLNSLKGNTGTVGRWVVLGQGIYF